MHTGLQIKCSAQLFIEKIIQIRYHFTMIHWIICTETVGSTYFVGYCHLFRRFLTIINQGGNNLLSLSLIFVGGAVQFLLFNALSLDELSVQSFTATPIHLWHGRNPRPVNKRYRDKFPVRFREQACTTFYFWFVPLFKRLVRWWAASLSIYV